MEKFAQVVNLVASAKAPTRTGFWYSPRTSGTDVISAQSADVVTAWAKLIVGGLLALSVTLAVVGLLLAIVQRRLASASIKYKDIESKIDLVKEQVVNSHSSNLREDIDSVRESQELILDLMAGLDRRQAEHQKCLESDRRELVDMKQESAAFRKDVMDAFDALYCRVVATGGDPLAQSPSPIVEAPNPWCAANVNTKPPVAGTSDTPTSTISVVATPPRRNTNQATKRPPRMSPKGAGN